MTSGRWAQTINDTVLPGPLFRVTQLRNDPAAGWLTSGGRFAVFLKWGMVWAGYSFLLMAIRTAANGVMDTETLSGFNVNVMGFSFPRLLTMGLAAVLLLPVRHLASVVRANAMAGRAKTDATEAARPIDDFQALTAEPDGAVVSLVGWVRGHGYLQHAVGGHQVVGLSLPCRGQHLVETLHNFDLVDEANETALVVAGGARLLGSPNTQLSRASQEDRALVNSLEMPAGVVPTYWNAFVVRDGDPVMVIGTKTIIHDMSELQRGRPAARTALASAPSRPLMLIPLAAERRDV